LLPAQDITMFETVLFDEGLEQAVHAMARSAFYSQAEIMQFFREIAHDDPDAGLDPKTVDEDVSRILAVATDELARNAAGWAEKTDNDKLAEAFQHLNQTGIRALENYGYEKSDCVELYAEIRGDPQWRGYCFYHNQDLVAAVLGGRLAIRFSAALDQPTDDANRAVGTAIVDVLCAHGLQPEWNGDPGMVISLPLEWRRRPNTG
jgi:hypothetical protein